MRSEEDNTTTIFPNFFVSAADGRTDLATALVGGLFLGTEGRRNGKGAHGHRWKQGVKTTK